MTVHAATITRAELGLSTLNLIDSVAGYDIRSFDPGDPDDLAEVAFSPYVKGGIGVGFNVGDARCVLVMRVTAASHAALQPALSTLASAFGQTTFTLSVSFDGTAWSYACRRALPNPQPFDTTPLGAGLRLRYTTLVGFQFSRSPIPVSGPF